MPLTRLWQVQVCRSIDFQKTLYNVQRNLPPIPLYIISITLYHISYRMLSVPANEI